MAAGMLPFALVEALAPAIASTPPFFGIFEHDQLLPLFINSGVLRFAATGGAAVSTAPLANGLVQTYNKVRQPLMVETSLIMDGATIKRVALLSQLYYYEDVQPTATFDLITPVNYFQNYTITQHAWEINDDRDQNVLILHLTFQRVPKPSDIALLSQAQGASPETWIASNLGRVAAQTAIAAATTYATKNLPLLTNSDLASSLPAVVGV